MYVILGRADQRAGDYASWLRHSTDQATGWHQKRAHGKARKEKEQAGGFSAIV